jgi:hypothetical protein
MKLSLPHVVKRGRKFYFRRRIPQELRQFYSNVDIVQALRTADKKTAIALAEAIDATLASQWADLLDPERTIIAQGRLLGQKRKVLDDATLRAAGRQDAMLWNLYRYAEKFDPEIPVAAPILSVPSGETRTLSEALALYLSLHNRGENQRFVRDTNTIINAVISVVGNKPL